MKLRLLAGVVALCAGWAAPASAFWQPGDLIATQQAGGGVPSRIVRANLANGTLDVIAEFGNASIDRVVVTPGRTIYTTTGFRASTALQRVDPVSGQPSVVASGGLLGQADANPLGLVALSESRVLVGVGGLAIEVDTATGAQRLVADLSDIPDRLGFGGMVRADADHVYFSYAAVDPNGQVPDFFNSFIGRMNVHTGAWSVVSNSGLLDFTLGIIVDSSGFIVAADQAAQLVRINPQTGAQFLLAEDFSLEGLYSVVEEAPNRFLTAGFFTTRTDLNSFPRHTEAHPATLYDLTYVPIPAPSGAAVLCGAAVFVARRRRA